MTVMESRCPLVVYHDHRIPSVPNFYPLGTGQQKHPAYLCRVSVVCYNCW